MTSTFTATFQQALRTFSRDIRSGEVHVLILSVILAVASLCAVGFFASRLEAGLKRDAAQLLGGDAVIASDLPTPAEFMRVAQQRGLLVASNAGFPSMALSAAPGSEETRLVSLKAVSESYPLRGFVRATQSAASADAVMKTVPAPGQVWVDGAVLSALKIPLGGELKLGSKTFTVSHEITLESDRGASFMSFAPRALINEADLAATGLVQPASRVTYRLAVAVKGGDMSSVKAYVQWAEAKIESEKLRGIRVESLESGRPEVTRTLDRAEGFLRLVALLSAMLAAVAVAIAARRFADRKIDACALMRVMGAPQRFIAVSFVWEFAFIALLAGVLGVVLGYAAHYVFAQLLAGLFEGGSLPPVNYGFALYGLAAGALLLGAFGLPPVLNIARVPPLRVIRRDAGLKLGSIVISLISLLGFTGLLLVMAKDLKLGAIAAGGFFVAWVLFVGAGFVASRAARVWASSERTGAALTLAAKQIAARPLQTGVQVAALGIGLLSLILLFLLRTDLISSWRQATPADAPNRFVINIQPDQAEAFQAALKLQGIQKFDWYPMIRGRLVAVNERVVTLEQYADERAKRLVDREFNLSMSDTLPSHNLVSSGRFYAAGSQEMSVEEGLAQTLGLKLGDTLEFDMGGQRASAKITSLRKVDWGSFRVNFFVLFPNAALKDAPVSYISAYHTMQGTVQAIRSSDNQMTRSFPNVTLIDVGASIAQVQQVLDQVIRAVEFLFLFAVAVGLTVLLAALRASEAERARFIAVLRALGGSRQMLSRALSAELILIGLLSGLLAAVSAGVVSWALARYVFEFAWTASPLLPLAGAVLGSVLAWAAGWWQLQSLIKAPVNQTLREA
jgi:putative ABC transport system permease protein